MSKILKKSEKGQKEFEPGVRTLSLKQRQLLVMVNGQRSVSELMDIFNENESVHILKELEKMGYIEDIRTVHHSNNRQPAHDDILEELSQAHVVFIKEYLTEQLTCHTGAFLNRDLINRIQIVQRSADLKPCISRWHMAIREARCGKEVADQMMEDLHYLIANPPTTTAPSMAS